MSPEIKPKKHHDLKVAVITCAFLLLMNLETLCKTAGSRWQVDGDNVGAEATKSAVFLVHLRKVKVLHGDVDEDRKTLICT